MEKIILSARVDWIDNKWRYEVEVSCNDEVDEIIHTLDRWTLHDRIRKAIAKEFRDNIELEREIDIRMNRMWVKYYASSDYFNFKIEIFNKWRGHIVYAYVVDEEEEEEEEDENK